MLYTKRRWAKQNHVERVGWRFLVTDGEKAISGGFVVANKLHRLLSGKAHAKNKTNYVSGGVI